MARLKKVLLALFLTTICSYTKSKILLITHAYNKPEFIEIQLKTFEKFLKNEYEFVVFNNAPNKVLSNEIKDQCKKFCIKCIDIPQEIHENIKNYNSFSKASINHCSALQWSYDNFIIRHDDVVGILDSDIFLVKKFDLKKEIKNYDIASWLRTCKEYHILSCQKIHPEVKEIKHFWPGIIFIDMKKIPNKEKLNFFCIKIANLVLDSGGSTYFYIKENKNLNLLPIDRIQTRDLLCCNCKNIKRKGIEYIKCNHNFEKLTKLNFDQNTINFIQNMPINIANNYIQNIEFFFNKSFIHYRAGSNYQAFSEEYIQEKNRIFNTFFSKILR